MSKPRALLSRERSWPAIALLCLALLLPVVCVIWFLNRAVENERLAARQKLRSAYSGQMDQARRRLEDFEAEVTKALDSAAITQSAPGIFARMVRTGVCHSLVVFGEGGRVRYPSDSADAGVSPSPAAFRSAWEVEFVERDYPAAARQYSLLANATQTPEVEARALLGQARSLRKSGQTRSALNLLLNLFRHPSYQNTADESGGSISVAAGLFAVKLLAETSADEARSLAGELAQRLNEYVDLELQADQRLFAMRELHDLFPDSALFFDTLEAELLARRFLEQAATVQNMKRSDLDQPGVLTVSSSGGTLLALFNQRRLRSELQPLVDEEFQQDDVEVKILLPGEESDRPGQAFLIQELGSYFPGWRLALTLRGGDPFASEAERRVTRYLLIALAVVTGASVLAFLIAGHFLSQLRLSRFRNDLVATVSHELKTPLSSTRALVETLLSGKLKDQDAEEDYLQLIRRENERLGRLIDNFLTFSRLEHKEALLKMRPVSVGKIVEKAVDAVSDLFDSSGRRLRLEIARDLPLIMADPDGLVIVLVNLLDNACKYSPGTKEVLLRAWQHESEVRIEVCDQGIGLSKRTVARIFDRFYQADQSLSQPTSGCGLGLSIVKFVTEAHGGSVQVLSRLGEGSRFRVALPVGLNPQETH